MEYSKEEIVALLMRRDDMEEHEAQSLVDDVQEQVNSVCEAGGDITEAEDIINSNLGLEPDYLMDFLPL